MTRFELATPRPPDVCATGLRYIPKKLLVNSYKSILNDKGPLTDNFVVEVSGFEPLTPAMSRRYSNQLSYTSIMLFFKSGRKVKNFLVFPKINF